MSVKKPSQPADNYIKDERRRETLEKRGGGGRSAFSPFSRWPSVVRVHRLLHGLSYTLSRARGGKSETQNGPSIQEVGTWIKSERGQRLGDRAISDLERGGSGRYRPRSPLLVTLPRSVVSYNGFLACPSSHPNSYIPDYAWPRSANNRSGDLAKVGKSFEVGFFLPSLLPSFLPSFLSSFVSFFLPFFLENLSRLAGYLFLPFFLSSFLLGKSFEVGEISLPSFLPSFLPFFLSSFLLGKSFEIGGISLPSFLSSFLPS